MLTMFTVSLHGHM